jgi:hypothetical protein
VRGPEQARGGPEQRHVYEAERHALADRVKVEVASLAGELPAEQGPDRRAFEVALGFTHEGVAVDLFHEDGARSRRGGAQLRIARDLHLPADDTGAKARALERRDGRARLPPEEAHP